jgi:hypothetical protein
MNPVTTKDAIISGLIVRLEGSNHYQVAKLMLTSGLLTENGFSQVGDNDDHTVMLVLKDGVEVKVAVAKLVEITNFVHGTTPATDDKPVGEITRRLATAN